MNKLLITLFLFFSFSSFSYAVGTELVDDLVQNITWMKDANYVKTSCDANNTLWQEFDLTALPLAERSGRSKIQICADNGTLNWYEAELWITVLNVNSYLGYNDWRQPKTDQPDTTCSLQGTFNEGFGYNCTGSELGHLFNTAYPAGLGNPNVLDDNCPIIYPYCFLHRGSFINAQSSKYWTGTALNKISISAWHFSTKTGEQIGADKKTNNFYIWPVRSGPPNADCDGVDGVNIQDVICTINAVLNP